MRRISKELGSMKKILLRIAILMFVVVTTGCNGKNNDGNNNNNNNIGPIIPSLSVLSESINLNIGETERIETLLEGASEETAVAYLSLNPDIATVDDAGLVSALSAGEAVIEVYLIEYPDAKTSVTVTVVDPEKEAEEAARQIIEDAIAELDAMIPAEVTGNISLPRFMRNYSVQLAWTSSDPDAISAAGRVVRRKEDQYVQLEATLRYHKNVVVEGVFKKTVKVEKYELRNLDGKKPVFAYYYQGSSLKDEDLDKIDVINYSFGYIINNQLSVSHLPNLATLANKAHAKGVRFVISVGGWGATGFGPMAATAENRAKFARSVVEVIKNYGLDGIDLDWEYPTTDIGSEKGKPEDKYNFTSLIRELRDALDEVDPELLLTAAFPAGSWGAQNYYEISEINGHLDYFHLMTYDMISYSSSAKTSHHTNLYPSKYSTSPQTSAASAVLAYQNAGADKSKIVIGGAFYGHIGTVTGNPVNHGMGLPTADFANSVTFAKIYTDYLNNPNFQRYFDDDAKAPWLFDGTTLITYDDPVSLGYKCEYIIQEGLGGIMFWQLGGDYESILVNAIYDSLNK